VPHDCVDRPSRRFTVASFASRGAFSGYLSVPEGRDSLQGCGSVRQGWPPTNLTSIGMGERCRPVAPGSPRSSAGQGPHRPTHPVADAAWRCPRVPRWGISPRRWPGRPAQRQSRPLRLAGRRARMDPAALFRTAGRLESAATDGHRQRENARRTRSACSPSELPGRPGERSR